MNFSITLWKTVVRNADITCWKIWTQGRMFLLLVCNSWFKFIILLTRLLLIKKNYVSTEIHLTTSHISKYYKKRLYEDSSLLGCDDSSIGKRLSSFWRNLLPPLQSLCRQSTLLGLQYPRRWKLTFPLKRPHSFINQQATTSHSRRI
jgi:hypothetical protein